MSFMQASSSHSVDLSSKRVAFIVDTPTPYLIPLLRELSSKVDLRCLFSSQQSTRGMAWSLCHKLSFPHAFIGGLVLRRRDANGIDAHVSPRLLWMLRHIRPDAIISGGFSFPTLYALVYCWLSGVPLLIFSDGTAFSERNQGWFRMRARKFLIPRVAALVAKSDLAARRFHSLGGGDKIFVAHHTTELASLLAVGAERRDLHPSDPLKLIWVGRMIRRKGVALLLAALAQLRVTPRPIHLTLVGTGPEEESLKSLVARLQLDNVTFAGFVQHDDLPNYYSDAHVFVMPTLQDPFGIVLLEAAGSGLALISSIYAGATHELVEEGVTGFAVDPADEVAFAGAIRRLATSHSLVVAMGRAAHRKAQQRTAQHCAAGYVKALQFALGSFGVRPVGKQNR